MSRAAVLVAAAALFAWLATANSGGYRYGVSDQAFYAAAVLKALHPDWFPRDTVLLDTQSGLMWADEIVAFAARASGGSLPVLYFCIYLVTLAALFWAALTFSRAARFSAWSTALLTIFLTFRHRIAKTGANTLEGYMHPRMLAFAFGVLALAAALRQRFVWAALAVLAAAVLHPTTAFWFAIIVAVAALPDPRYRLPIVVLGVLAAVAGAWAMISGPLAARMVTMDAAWLAVLAEKDYLFPTDWPAYAWVTNLAYPAIIVAIYRRRKTLAATVPGEPAFIVGVMALFGVFLITVPFTAARIALAVQSQSTRVFWVLDFVAIAYLAWWLTTDVVRSRAARAAIVGIVLAASIARGTYLLTSPGSNRDLVTIDFPVSPWIETLTWLRHQPPTWHVLADPGHAWKYGISVRLAAEKDALIETGKDSALAMYDRAIAMRVADRVAATGGYPDLTTAALRDLDARYALDVAIVETGAARHSLPELYRNTQFVVYDLR